MRYFRLVFAFFFSLFSVSAFSADYYWLKRNDSSTHYSSAVSACTALATQSSNSSYAGGGSTYVTYTYKSFALINSSQQLYYCTMSFVTYVRATGSINNQGTIDQDGTGKFSVTRYGDSCPAGTAFDSTTGGCVNSCSSKAGTTERMSRTGTLNDGVYNLITASNGKKYSARGENFATGCKGGCMADTSSFKCTYNISHNLYACRGVAVYSGQTCSAQGAIDPAATDLPDPDPQTTKDSQPCIYATDGSGKKTCTSKNITETEGQQCGTFNGKDICPPQLPSKNGVTIATQVTDTPNADGTSTETKTDTATTIQCDGYETCVTKVTTITTTTTKDGNGNSTGATSSCTGAYCAGSNTSPDANGDGLGDCVSGDCADGDGEGGGGPTTPKLDDVDDYQTTTQKFYDSVKGSPIASAVGNISAPDTGVAPSLTTGALPSLGGISLDYGIIRDLKVTLDDVMQPTMKAFWCFVAVMVFLLA